MQRVISAAAGWLALIAVSVSSAERTDVTFADSDWPCWRGPSANGHAAPDQRPPTQWSQTENVVWRAAIVGRGHGSPTVVGDAVYLAAADEEKQVQYVVCYDRASGERRWQTAVHRGKLMIKNAKGSAASSTPACDGKRLFINFANGDALHTTALDLVGKILWQTKISDYVMHQGYGASPAIFGPLVIVSADNKGGGAIAGLDRATGEVVWRRDRPAKPNYASPVVLEIAGRQQLLFTGCDLVSSLDPRSGEVLWETEGATTECVTTTVTDGKHIYTSGGYPKNHVAAVLADGSGKVAWENNTRVYVPSMLVKDGYLYAVGDAGVALCFDAATGEEMWKGRLGGTFSSSLVLVGEQLFATSEDGTTFIFRARPEKFELLASNELGDEVLATPAICGSCIYMRVAEKNDGQRQEFLYCLGKQ